MFLFQLREAENTSKNGKVIDDKKNVDNIFCLNYSDKDHLQKNINVYPYLFCYFLNYTIKR